MIVTYRMFEETNGQYTFRELFCERDGRVIAYGKAPITPRGGSPRELAQELAGLQEALALPVLTVAAVEAIIAKQPPKTRQGRKTISHADLVAKLGLETGTEADEPVLASAAT
jgi:hypothetical protein